MLMPSFGPHPVIFRPIGLLGSECRSPFPLPCGAWPWLDVPLFPAEPPCAPSR